MEQVIQSLRTWRSSDDYANGFSVDELYEYLEEQGLDLLGNGAFGVVVDYDDFVVKIFDATDIGYLGFIHFCETVGPNRYLPEIYYSERISDLLHMVVIERLDTKKNIEKDKEYKGIRWHGLRCDFVPSCGLNEDVKAVLSLMKTYREEYNFAVEEHNSTTRIEGGEYKVGICHDIHSSNIMFRGKQLVITDPWCC